LPEISDDRGTINVLCRLLRCRSVTPDDAGCQSILRTELETLGFTCEDMPFGEVSNLWARRGTGSPLLCFAGHTDVVPPGAIEQWQSDPFEPSVRDGKLYARGAADMKGSLAAMIIALRRFLAAEPAFTGSLALLITSDEEGRARDGTLKVIERLSARNERIDWCIVGEPSSHERVGDVIRIGRRGSLSAEITVHGVQGHVAYPQLADNPIHRFAPALAELTATRWDEGNEHFPPTSFQVVRVASDAGAVNVIPGSLTARCNFRYSTVWHHEELRDKLQAVLSAHGVDSEIRWHLSGEPFLTKSGRLIEAVSESVSEATGAPPELSTGGGTSDGRFIAPSGADVVELGPVNASIHKVNEFVSLDELAQLSTMYESIMTKLLRQ